MADLGTLDTRPSRRYDRVLPVYAATNAAHGARAVVLLAASLPQRWWTVTGTNNVPCSYTLGGRVLRLGVPVAGVTVRLHLRASGMLIQATKTDALGYYTFAGLPADAAAFFATVLDPLNTENGLILDRLSAA